MNYLSVFNFVVNILIVSYFIYTNNKFYITANRTFWCKKIYSYTLWKYTHKSEYGSSSIGVFTFPIRNRDKMEDWDSAMFRSGEYKKYATKKSN